MTADLFGMEQAPLRNLNRKTASALSAALQTLEGTT